jgi:hypothetical protein
MEDYKLRDLHASHTLGQEKYFFVFFVFFLPRSARLRRHWVARGRGMEWLVCNGCEDGCASDGGKRSCVRRNDDDAGIFEDVWREKYICSEQDL